LLGNLPAPGTSPTCETAGVIAPITHIIGSMQVAEALKFLTGHLDRSDVRLIAYDVWSHRFQRIDVGTESMSTCPVCSKGTFEYLSGNPLRTITLCGRNAVQIARSGVGALNFVDLAERLKPAGDVAFNDFLLRFRVDGYDITVFRDARSIIRGTADPAVARGLYARYIGA